MVDAHTTLETLRSIKNTIIGNPTAKKNLASDGTVSVLEWINASDRISEPIFEEIRIEAAHIVATQAYGPPEALVAVLEAQAPQALITALKHARYHNVPRLAVALTRALRAIISAAAETISPIRWHFQRNAAHPARLEARLVLEDTFSPDALGVVLPYLRHPEPDVRRNIAIMIARGLVIDPHRTRITEYEGRAAIWSLIGMLGGDDRNKSAAAYALAEISRDNDTMSRILTDRIPLNALSSVTKLTLTGSGWGDTDPSTSNGTTERGRLSVQIPGPEPGSLLSMSRPSPTPSQFSRGDSVIDQGKDEHTRVLDILCKFLPSRDGDLREAACLCLSTILRRPPAPSRDPIHAMVMWLNLAFEEFAPAPDSSFRISTPDPPAHPNPKTQWMQKCRWKPNEIGGGEVARRVVGACYIIADFVNDREDLLGYVLHAGTLHRAVRALLVLPPVPIPPGKVSPALSGRWGPGSSSSPSSGVPSVTTTTATPAPLNPNPPSGLARTRQASNATRNPGHFISPNPPIGFAPVPEPVSNMRTRGAGATPPPVPAAGPSSATGPTSPAPAPVSPPPPIIPATSGSPPSPVQRRLSFAELARRASESGGEAFTRRAPSAARRTSSAGVTTPVVSEIRTGAGTPVTGISTTTAVSPSLGAGTAASDPPSATAIASTRARSDNIMAVDSEAGRDGGAGSEDVTMASTSADPMQNTDILMSNTGTPTSARLTPAPTPIPVPVPVPAPVPTPAARRRKKPPPDPALGPYTFSSSTPTPAESTLSTLPPAPESPLRAALLVLLASLAMHSDEPRRLLGEAGALGGIVPPGRRIGVAVSAMKPGEIEGVTGVLGALGSPDPEVRWAGVMVARALGRSMSGRTGLYDSGIGRAAFEMLMHGEPDRRVLVAVMRVCCNLLNQYSPMREMFIRDGGMKKLAELYEAEEQTIRVLSLWAFRNSLFRATSDEKRSIMATLGWTRLDRALEEPPGELLEQALGIVRNISATEPDAEWLVTLLSPSKVIEAAERTLGSDESASSASLFALAHIAFIPRARSHIIGRRRILEFICASLAHGEVQIRAAAALCVAQMAGCMPRRLKEMKEVRIDERLKVMKARETDEDVRDNVSRALAMFESRET
ncbi:Armadillo repeat protein [Ceratobasidium theobromae]|uniref:Armadillo repeat protein n=1 Tax=Ceratobasidium theobromae TaxID=1582974 RepID=A0A5N5QA65_9AGAM|nr:Armadillo repeat protein [Ceratobasidium theobromae]